MKVKFCGGCNPFYDRKNVYLKLLENKKIQEIDVIVLLNGCQRGCREYIHKNIINVQEFIITNNSKNISEEAIYNWIIEILKL